MVRKLHLPIEIYKIVSIVKLSVFSYFLVKCWNFVVNSQIVSYYDVINCDITLLASKDVITNKEHLTIVPKLLVIDQAAKI